MEYITPSASSRTTQGDDKNERCLLLFNCISIINNLKSFKNSKMFLTRVLRTNNTEKRKLTVSIWLCLNMYNIMKRTSKYFCIRLCRIAVVKLKSSELWCIWWAHQKKLISSAEYKYKHHKIIQFYMGCSKTNLLYYAKFSDITVVVIIHLLTMCSSVETVVDEVNTYESQ